MKITAIYFDIFMTMRNEAIQYAVFVGETVQREDAYIPERTSVDISAHIDDFHKLVEQGYLVADKYAPYYVTSSIQLSSHMPNSIHE